MDKIASIFGKKKRFKGQSHKLGSAEPKVDKKPEQNQFSNSRASPQQIKVFEGKAHLASSTRPSPSGSNVGSAHGHMPASGAAQNSANASSAPARGRQESSEVGQDRARNSSQGLDSIGPQATASVEIREAVGQLLQGEPGCFKTIQTILLNILKSPDEAKYRKVRLGNPKIQAAVVNVDGGLELLQACGFLVDGMDSETEVFAYLPEDEELGPLISALSLLDPNFQQGSTVDHKPRAYQDLSPVKPVSLGSDQTAIACDRQTVVIVPMASATSGPNIADWVYERSPAELKAAIKATQARRQQSEMLMTRAMREKLQVGSKPAYSQATVRVRLPEGLILQGKFNGAEPVAEIFNWLTDCLARPDTAYDLMLPNRRPLVTSMGTVKQADLLPSVLLHFQTEQGQAATTLTLRPEIMARTAESDS